MDKYTDNEFLKQAFEVNKHLKPDYSLGAIKSYKDIPGWLNDTEWIYERMVNESQDGDEFLEIGTFFGQSTARMCELIRNSKKKIKFYTMDTYHEMEVALVTDRHPQSFKDFRNEHSYTDVYNLTKNILTFLGLNEYVEQIVCDSKYGYRLFENDTFKMIYMNGNHHYDSALSDLINLWPKVKKNGYIVYNDTAHESVMDAVRNFCIENSISNQEVEFNNNSCIIKKN
jgi:hypothetical protein